MKIEITQPQSLKPKRLPSTCMDCGKRKLRGEDKVETCSQWDSYLLLCGSCYGKRGNTVR